MKMSFVHSSVRKTNVKNKNCIGCYAPLRIEQLFGTCKCSRHADNMRRCGLLPDQWDEFRDWLLAGLWRFGWMLFFDVACIWLSVNCESSAWDCRLASNVRLYATSISRRGFLSTLSGAWRTLTRCATFKSWVRRYLRSQFALQALWKQGSVRAVQHAMH